MDIRKKISAYLTDQFGIEAKDNEICAESKQEDCPIDPKRMMVGWAVISVKGGSMADGCVGVSNVKKLEDDPFFCLTCTDSVF